MFRNLVDHPIILVGIPLLALLVLAVGVYVIYRVVRAGVRDGRRDALRRQGGEPHQDPDARP